jgi:hypothetical protein
MTGLAIGLAVLFAVVVLGYRRWQRARELARRPGATIDRAIPVSRFDDIEVEVFARRCACGTRVRAAGEGSQQQGERRYRVVHVVCPECEREDRVFFDVTQVFH